MKTINSPLIFIVFFLSFSTFSTAQQKVIDSLNKELVLHKINDTIKVNLLNTISYRYNSFDIDKSLENAQKANSLAKQLNFKKGEAKSLLRFCSINLKKSEMADAEKNAQNALKLYEELNDQDGITASYINLGNIAYYNNDSDKALEYYNVVLNSSIKNGDLKQQASILNNIGGVSASIGDLDDALKTFKKSYAIREQLGEERSGLSALNNIGAICLNQGKYKEALEYLNKCLSIHREDNNKRGITSSTYNISAVYYELEQYDKTLMYLEESLKFAKELKSKRQMASCLVNIGAVYADLKEFPKALDFMMQSLNISKDINDKSELSAGHFQLGDLYFLMGQPKMALKHHNTCLEISESIDSKIYICHAQIGIAKALVELKNYSEALNHALEGKRIAENLELLAQQKLASGILAKIYSNTNNYKKAFASHQQFKILNDSLFNKENLEKITQLEYEYKYKQALDSASIRELQLTQTVKATSQNLEKSQRTLFLGVITFLTLALVLVAIIFFLKLRNEKAKTQFIEIEQKLLRSQMTPHFIFNSLSVLQGMILNKEDKKSVLYLSKFSKLLRITLENSRDKTVPLHQELEAVNNYLELQNLEVSQSYQYTILVDDKINTSLFEIPPMLIQPFIENAIEHGFKDLKEHRKIDIQLTYSDRKLICTIKDNGIGIDIKRANNNGHKKSLATTITSERLKMLSKDFITKGSVTIENRQKFNEQGTIVTLVIPYKYT